MTEEDGEQLLREHAEVLFRFDPAGRLTTTNEPEPELAPRLFLCRGRLTTLAWFRADVGVDVARRCEAAVDRIELFDGRPAPASAFAEIARYLSVEGRVNDLVTGPAFVFEDRVVVDGAEEVREIDAESDALLERHFPYTRRYLEPRSPVVGIVLERTVVSACYSARRNADACEAGVATEESYRGRGFGARVVAAWRAAVEREGLTPLYSTTWDNVASMAIARRLRLVPYAETLSIS